MAANNAAPEVRCSDRSIFHWPKKPSHEMTMRLGKTMPIKPFCKTAKAEKKKNPHMAQRRRAPAGSRSAIRNAINAQVNNAVKPMSRLAVRLSA